MSFHVTVLNAHVGAQMPEMMEAEVPPKYHWSVFICENVGMLLGGTAIVLINRSANLLILTVLYIRSPIICTSMPMRVQCALQTSSQCSSWR